LVINLLTTNVGRYMALKLQLTRAKIGHQGA
jgi:hypothetical protein